MSAEDAVHLDRFFGSTAQRPLLGLVYGRRRIGKSYMLSAQVRARGGFYFEATRVETPLQLERLGPFGAVRFGDRVDAVADRRQRTAAWTGRP